MPYESAAELPASVRGALPKHAQEIYRSAFNAALKQYGSEEKAAKVAWAAVKGKYGQSDDGKWQRKTLDDPFFLYTDSFEIKSDAEGKMHEVVGYISHEGIDLVNDYVTPECLKDMVSQIKDRSVSIKLGRDHEHVLDDPRIMPLARIYDATYDGKGVLSRIKMNEDHPDFPKVWGSIKNGFYDSFSIEFKPLEYQYEQKGGRRVRRLNKVYLGGVTFTGRPVCQACRIVETCIKSLAIGEDEIKGDGEVAEANITFPQDGKPAVPDGTKPNWPEKQDGTTFPQEGKPSYKDPTAATGYQTKSDSGVENTGVKPTEKKAEETEEEKKKREAEEKKKKEETKSFPMEALKEMIHDAIREEIKSMEPTSKIKVEAGQKPLEMKSMDMTVTGIMSRQILGRSIGA